MKHLRAADYHRQPWKNGLGSTTELASAPHTGGGFYWRLSIADVAADGAFSTFPDIDRVICVIEGAGMTLEAGSHGDHVLVPFEPFAFPGEWPIMGRLKAGPVRDFNLMVDRRYGSGELAVHDFAKGALHIKPGALHFVHLLAGRVPELAAGDTLLLEPDDAPLTLSGTGIALHGSVHLKP